MKNEVKLQFVLFSVSAFSCLLFYLGYVLTNSTIFNLCLHDQYNCRDFLNEIGDPLYYTMPAFAMVFLLFALFPGAVSVWWKKFAIWYIPTAAFILALYRDPPAGDLFSPDPKTVYLWVAAIFFLGSLYFIILHRGNESNQH